MNCRAVRVDEGTPVRSITMVARLRGENPKETTTTTTTITQFLELISEVNKVIGQ